MAKKKRFKQSVKDRMDESRGMERRLDGYYDSSYREMYGDGFLYDDKSAPSNMPRQVIEQRYPEMGGLESDQAYDTIRGIDRQMYSDKGQLKKQLKLEKY